MFNNSLFYGAPSDGGGVGVTEGLTEEELQEYLDSNGYVKGSTTGGITQADLIKYLTDNGYMTNTVLSSNYVTKADFKRPVAFNPMYVNTSELSYVADWHANKTVPILPWKFIDGSSRPDVSTVIIVFDASFTEGVEVEFVNLSGSRVLFRFQSDIDVKYQDHTKPMLSAYGRCLVKHIGDIFYSGDYGTWSLLNPDIKKTVYIDGDMQAP